MVSLYDFKNCSYCSVLTELNGSLNTVFDDTS